MRAASLARGTPIAFETKGTVREANLSRLTVNGVATPVDRDGNWAATVTIDAENAEIVVVAQGEERQVHALLIETSAHWKTEHATVEIFRSLEIRDFEHHVPQGLNLHKNPPPLDRG